MKIWILFRHLIALLGRGHEHFARPLFAQDNIDVGKRTFTCMPGVEFEFTIPVLEFSKSVRVIMRVFINCRMFDLLESGLHAGSLFRHKYGQVFTFPT